MVIKKEEVAPLKRTVKDRKRRKEDEKECGETERRQRARAKRTEIGQGHGKKQTTD